MIRATFTVTGTDALDKKRFTRKFNKVVQGIGAQVASELQPALKDEFVEPGPVVYPIQWASKKQRRAFFATNGFGGGIPTKRTGRSNAGWKVLYTAVKDATGTFQLENDVPYTKYVRGTFNNTRQQPFHIHTGWQRSTVVRGRVFEKAKAMIAARFDESLGSFGSLAL